MKSFRCLTIITILSNTVFLLGITTTSVTANVEIKKLKVCADPNYMPFSHKNKSGYENQIAELIGKELNTPVEYTWFPQRLGFIRNTLKKESESDGSYLCDLVMGVPNNYGMAMTTKPYLHSTYALVTLKNGKLKDLIKGNDLVKLPPEKLNNLSVAITERSPGAVWLARYALYEQMAPYISQSGDPNIFPGEPMLRDLLAGKVDAAIVWGPTAGYFARKDENVRVINLKSEPGIRFDFSISAAVRHGEKEWRNKVDGLLKKNSAKINEILTKAGVPLLAIKSESERVEKENKSNKKKGIEIVPPIAPVAPNPPKAPLEG